MEQTKTNLLVAKEILRQLGGNKFIAMTGAKYIAGDNNSLHFQIGRNKGNYKGVVIALNRLDLYDIKFWKEKKVSSVAESPVIYDIVYNVYAEDLQAIFTSKTGLYTHL